MKKTTEKAEKKPSKFTNLLLTHSDNAKSSLGKLVAQPWSSLSTVFVIATALLLPACLLVLNSSLEVAVENFRSSARVTLYLTSETITERALAVSESLLTREDVSSTDFVSAERALEEFSAATGLDSVLTGLGANPLPAAIIVEPIATQTELISDLAAFAASLPEVESVQVDESWIQRAEAIANTFGFLGQSLGLIFALGVSFIVGNAVRMTVESRKDEIRVIKLVGGSESFIARPLLYTGVWYGLFGALLAVLVLLVLVFGANAALQGQGEALLPGLVLQGPGIEGVVSLLLAGPVLGWLAAGIASWHYIRAIRL